MPFVSVDSSRQRGWTPPMARPVSSRWSMVAAPYQRRPHSQDHPGVITVTVTTSPTSVNRTPRARSSSRLADHREPRISVGAPDTWGGARVTISRLGRDHRRTGGQGRGSRPRSLLALGQRPSLGAATSGYAVRAGATGSLVVGHSSGFVSVWARCLSGARGRRGGRCPQVPRRRARRVVLWTPPAR